MRISISGSIRVRCSYFTVVTYQYIALGSVVRFRLPPVQHPHDQQRKYVNSTGRLVLPLLIKLTKRIKPDANICNSRCRQTAVVKCKLLAIDWHSITATKRHPVVCYLNTLFILLRFVIIFISSQKTETLLRLTIAVKRFRIYYISITRLQDLPKCRDPTYVLH